MANYHKGAADERRVRTLLEADGYMVIRAAGSLGAADLVAIGDVSRGHVYALNVKRSVWAPPADRVAMVAVWWPCSVRCLLVRVLAVRRRLEVAWREVHEAGAMSEVEAWPPWAA